MGLELCPCCSNGLLVPVEHSICLFSSRLAGQDLQRKWLDPVPVPWPHTVNFNCISSVTARTLAPHNEWIRKVLSVVVLSSNMPYVFKYLLFHLFTFRAHGGGGGGRRLGGGGGGKTEEGGGRQQLAQNT